MKNRLLTIAALCVLPSIAWADPPGKGPSNGAVLLPPQMFDDTAKGPNNARESYGQWSISGGVLLVQPVFDSNPAFLVNGANFTRQVDFSHRLDAAPTVWLGYVSERGWG